MPGGLRELPAISCRIGLLKGNLWHSVNSKSETTVCESRTSTVYRRYKPVNVDVQIVILLLRDLNIPSVGSEPGFRTLFVHWQ